MTLDLGERVLEGPVYPASGGAGDHDDRQPEGARRLDLAVGREAAAVLRHDDLDAVPLQQAALLGRGEGSAGEQGLGAVRQVAWIDGLDAADEVAVPGRGAEGADLLAADGEEDAAGRGPEGGGGGGGIRDLDPAVAGLAGPAGAAERDERDGRRAGSRGRVGRDPAGEGVGAVDEDTHALGGEPGGEAGGAAEAADPDGAARKARRLRAAGERIGDAEAGARGEVRGEVAGRARASEDEDMHAAF